MELKTNTIVLTTIHESHCLRPRSGFADPDWPDPILEIRSEFEIWKKLIRPKHSEHIYWSGSDPIRKGQEKTPESEKKKIIRFETATLFRSRFAVPDPVLEDKKRCVYLTSETKPQIWSKYQDPNLVSESTTLHIRIIPYPILEIWSRPESDPIKTNRNLWKVPSSDTATLSRTRFAAPILEIQRCVRF